MVLMDVSSLLNPIGHQIHQDFMKRPESLHCTVEDCCRKEYNQAFYPVLLGLSDKVF